MPPPLQARLFTLLGRKFTEDDTAATWEQEAPAEVQETAELSVDRTGQRLVSTQTVQHDYLTLGGRVARETITTDGTVTAVLDFIYDSQGRPFALNCSTDGGNSFTTYYYVLNLQGDVVKLISYIPGFEYEEVASYTYDAWGNIISATGEKAELNPLRYRGYYYDTETGFYYLQSRYYDPANHRFINADVYTSTDSTDAISCNMFAYCGNNPVNRSDAEGQFWHLIVGAVIGAVVAAVTTAVTGGDLGDVLIAAAGGAVSGALTASGAGTLAQVAGGAAISMATNAATQAKEIVSGEKKLSDFSIGSMLMDGVAGAACGFISGPGASNGLGGAFKNNQMVELGFNTVKRTANAFVRHGSKAYLKEAGKAAKYYIKSTIKVTKNLFKGRSFASQAANFVYNWVKD